MLPMSSSPLVVSWLIRVTCLDHGSLLHINTASVELIPWLNPVRKRLGDPVCFCKMTVLMGSIHLVTFGLEETMMSSTQTDRPVHMAGHGSRISGLMYKAECLC